LALRSAPVPFLLAGGAVDRADTAQSGERGFGADPTGLSPAAAR
jgi:hypothetical protein